MSGHVSRATAYALVLPTVQSIPPLRAYLTFRIIGLKKLLYGQQNAFHTRDLTWDDAPMGKEFGNPWGAPKDRKQWIDAKSFPAILRK